MKKALPKQIVLTIAAIAVMAVLVAAIASLWELRPVIEFSASGYAYIPNSFSFNRYGAFYTTTMPDTYTFVNSNTPLMVALYWENKGNTDASLQLTLTAQNANITWISNYGSDSTTTPVWGKESDGQAYNGSIATFHVETKAHSAVQIKYLNVFPIGNPQNFTITYSVKGTSNAFSSLTPNGRATATYELADENFYQLVS